MTRRRSDGDLRRIFRARLPAFHWQSVETGMTGGGVPDSNYCASITDPKSGSVTGREGWVEYKWTGGWAVGIDPAQVGWLLRRARAGGRVCVAVRRLALAGVRRRAADELWVVSGASADRLRAAGLRGLRPAEVLGCWTGGPARWDWAAVGAILIA